MSLELAAWAGPMWVKSEGVNGAAAAVASLDATFAGTVFFGPGYHTLSAPLEVGAKVVLQGSGVNSTILQMSDANLDLIRVTGSDVQVRDMTLLGPGTAGTGCGVRTVPGGGAGIVGLCLDRLRIVNTASWSVCLTGNANGLDITIESHLNRVRCEAAASGGNLYVGQNCTSVDALGSRFLTEIGYPVHAYYVEQVVLERCTLERAADAVFALWEVTHDCAMRDCRIESHAATGVNPFIEARTLSVGLSIESPLFVRPTATAPRLFKTTGGANPCKSCRIVNAIGRIGTSGTPTGLDDVWLTHAADDLTVTGGLMADIPYTGSRAITIQQP